MNMSYKKILSSILVALIFYTSTGTAVFAAELKKSRKNTVLKTGIQKNVKRKVEPKKEFTMPVIEDELVTDLNVKNKGEFLEQLSQKMEIAKESLEIKRKLLEDLTDKNLYPYTKFYLRDIKARFGVYWKNHFSTIGLIGMNEACLNLLGSDIGSFRGKQFALDVMDFMRAKIVEFQKETRNNYNLEATPGEGTSYRLAKLDRNHKYKYFTNSTQLPVNYSDDIFEVLDHQDDLQTKYTGGTVVHIFAGERISNIETMKNLVKKVCNNYKLPYFTFSPTFSTCPNHGYVAGEHFKCPDCGADCEVYSRIVGYIRPVSQWNKGKQTEFHNRTPFDVEACGCN